MLHSTVAPAVKDMSPAGLIAASICGLRQTSAAEELSCLHEETVAAVMLLRGFRDRTSTSPAADLRAAFTHIDNALAHSRSLCALANAGEAGDQMLLHLSMQHFQAVLSDIPQISYLSSRMIDSFLEIKDELLATRQTLVPVRM